MRGSSFVVMSLFVCVAPMAWAGEAPATVQVTTASDVVAADGACSLREALAALKDNNVVDTCNGIATNTIEIDAANIATVTLAAPLTIDSPVIVLTANGTVNIDGGGARNVITIVGVSAQFVNLNFRNFADTGSSGALMFDISQDAVADFQQCHFTNNTATHASDNNYQLVAADSSTVLMTACVVQGNSFVNGSDERRGGLFNFGNTSFSVADTVLKNNTVGGVFNAFGTDGADRVVRESVFVENAADALFTSSGRQTNLISVYASDNGGALFQAVSNGGGFRVSSSTLLAAASDSYLFFLQNGDTLDVQSSILLGSSMCTTGASLGNNIINAQTSCFTADETDLVGTDALLGSLGDHGGLGPVRLPAPNSPAVDAGLCDAMGAYDLSGDVRGFARDANCDIGAVELQASELGGEGEGEGEGEGAAEGEGEGAAEGEGEGAAEGEGEGAAEGEGEGVAEGEGEGSGEGEGEGAVDISEGEGEGEDAEGCTCTSSATGASSTLWGIAMLGAVLRRRRNMDRGNMHNQEMT